MITKAISIKGEWAILLWKGKKTIETRTWKTNYRGPILLCASKLPKTQLSGQAFAYAELVDCRPMTPEDEEKACCLIYPRAYSWVLENITAILPFPVKGQLGLFNTELRC